MINYYEILEVSPNASQETIRAAYKSLMQRHHPDKNPGDSNSEEQAAKISNAYQCLSDPDARAKYNAGFESKLKASGRPAGNQKQSPTASPPSNDVPTSGRTIGFILGFVMLLMIGSSIFYGNTNGVSKEVTVVKEATPNYFEEQAMEQEKVRNEAKRKTGITFSPYPRDLLIEIKDAVHADGKPVQVLIPVISITFWSTTPNVRIYSPSVRKAAFENKWQLYEKKMRLAFSQLKYDDLMTKDTAYRDMRVMDAIGSRLDEFCVRIENEYALAEVADSDRCGYTVSLPQGYSVL